MNIISDWYLSFPVYWQIILIYIIGINILTFLFFGFDKFAAFQNNRRIAEKTLWLLTALGGSVGALGAMKLFRHKTRKTSFFSIIVLFFFLHVSLVLTFFIYKNRG